MWCYPLTIGDQHTRYLLAGRGLPNIKGRGAHPVFERTFRGHFLVKRVTSAGTLWLKHKLLFIANALKQHHIGLEETDDGIWTIYSGSVLLAKVDERGMIIRD